MNQRQKIVWDENQSPFLQNNKKGIENHEFDWLFWLIFIAYCVLQKITGILFLDNLMPKDYFEWLCLWYLSLIALFKMDLHIISGSDFFNS